MTQFRLAANADISPTTLCFIERGGSTTMRTLTAICNALGVKPHEVAGIVIKKRVGKTGGWQVVEDPFNVAV